MLKVKTVVEQMKVGMSKPFLVVCDDDQQYVMKYSVRQAENSKALFNELLGYHIIDFLKLNHPEFQCAKLSRDTVNENADLIDAEPKIGTVFVTKYHNYTPAAVPNILKSATNIDTFLGIIFYDQFIVNIDRGLNRGNWLIDRKDMKLNVVDNDRILKQQQFWTPATLKEISKIPPFEIEALEDVEYEYLLEAYGDTHGKHSFDHIVRKVKSMSPDIVDKWLLDIPVDWLITETDKLAIKEFILFQVKHVEEIVDYLVVKFSI
ncbi:MULTISPECIES: HipA family kinase [Leuconostoc gelidum group]|uniref:HipA family kinase n=1 Tax=Leuconostoc gelidum group TaxID=3016637 RepID=UPI001CC7FE5C|nr:MULTISPECIES: HipA family kinase [Leuconostoc gelidum group]MBZ5951040.1 hypothetical protein [Leuconostoc gasicomitatum]MBZ5985947.1 hypothetical protein [Leuconostoc gelidum subsp. gelidum]